MPELDPNLLPLLRAPDSGEELVGEAHFLTTADQSARFPLVNGIPILLSRDSAFSAADYLNTPTSQPGIGQRLGRIAKRTLPSLSHNLSAARNFARFGNLLRDALGAERAQVLVVGGATLGEGMQEIGNDPAIHLVQADIAVGPRTDVICDAHALPFADAVFDGVVCQAVLEHVADPPQVVSEIHRVLKPQGLVYSEIPFMQQVHEGAYDFTRYTYNGHRRLFRWFEEIDAGPTAGPGMALGWSVRALLSAIAGEHVYARTLANLLTTLTLFWLKYLDRPLMAGTAGLDGASGTFFLGSARATPRPDQEILDGYRGVNSGFSVSR